MQVGIELKTFHFEESLTYEYPPLGVPEVTTHHAFPPFVMTDEQCVRGCIYETSYVVEYMPYLVIYRIYLTSYVVQSPLLEI